VGLGIRLRSLWHIRGWVAGCIVFSLVAALWSIDQVTLFPPGLKSRSLHMATATTQLVVDYPRSGLVDIRQDTYGMTSLTNRAILLGNVIASPPVRDSIARRAHVPVNSLQILPPLTPKQPRTLAEAGNERHTSDILKLNDQYRLSIQANPTVPILHIYAQAPSAESAGLLANGAVDSLRGYLTTLAGSSGTPGQDRIKLTQLGRAEGDVIDDGIAWRAALLAFILTLGASLATVIFFRRVREGWRLSARAEGSPALD
jgi:hypothetical protein